MAWESFVWRVIVAMLLGAAIGIERQYRHGMAGLRTNALVATGAALFVLVSNYTGDIGSAGRMAGQVVSGIGFLGAGVIMREGLNVRGLNTAATLWCSAAVGVLSGLGLLWEASLGAVVILSANTLLRAVAKRIDRLGVMGGVVEQRYAIYITCQLAEEVQVRAFLVHSLSEMKFTLRSLLSEDLDKEGFVQVTANLLVPVDKKFRLEKIVSRASLEKGVSAVSWELINDEEEEHA